MRFAFLALLFSMASPVFSEPGDIKKWLSYGQKMLASDEADEAIAAFKKVGVQDPENTEALRGLAKAYADKGDFQSSKRYQKLATKLETFNEENSEVSPAANMAGVRNSISVEVAYQDKGYTDSDVDAGVNASINSLKSLGWSTAKSVKKASDRSRFGFGVRYDAFFEDGFIFGGGIRTLASSTYNYEITDSTNTPYYQWVNYTQSGEASVFGIHLGFGYHAKLGVEERDIIRFGGEPEIGFLSGNEKATLKGSNSAAFDRSVNVDFASVVLGGALTAGYEHLFNNQFSLGFDGGYRVLKFDNIKVERITANYAVTTKIGDVLKDSSGAASTLSMNGAFARIRACVLF